MGPHPKDHADIPIQQSNFISQGKKSQEVRPELPGKCQLRDPSVNALLMARGHSSAARAHRSRFLRFGFRVKFSRSGSCQSAAHKGQVERL